MPENKQSVSRSSSYLSYSAYRKIKRVLSFRRRVFGQRLEETVLYERRYGVHMAPLVVEQCADFIRDRGLLEVGLFRQPGQATLVKELQEAFDAGEKPSFDSSTDVHTVASLLKLYLRELPEPLVPFSRYQDFLMVGKKIPSERTQGLLELKMLLYDLPVANFNLLNYICQFLNEVQSYSGSNKMSTQNLATVFGPNILRPKAEDPESIIGGAAVVQQLMSELIREHQNLFSREGATVDPPSTSRPDSYPCQRRTACYFDGGHTKPCAPPRDHLSLPQRAPQPCARQLSLPLIGERRSSSLSPPNASYTSFTACLFHTNHQLPEGISPGTPPTAGPLYPRHTQSQPLSHPRYQSQSKSPGTGDPASPLFTASASTVTLQADIKDPDHSSAAPSGGRTGTGDGAGAGVVEPGTVGTSGGSSEAQDSTLSVYDNLETPKRMEEVTGEGEVEGEVDSHVGTAETEPELEAATASMADTSSSWSSCEVLPLDDTGMGGRPCPRPRSARFASFRTDPGEDDHANPNSPASSSAPTDAPLSTGSSEVFLPSAPLDPLAPPPPQAIHCLLAGLRQQMARQRAEYDTKIHRLERRNEALHGEVVVLRANLEQQRRWYSIAEIKIRNVERARADADRRNSTLQREMEQFFDTFGELSAETRQGEHIV